VGVEYGTGKHSSVLVWPPLVTSSDQSVGSHFLAVMGSSRTFSSPMSVNCCCTNPSAQMSAS
jgi:hypothetical protein